MAIFHLTHSFVRRSNGSSTTATAAYNAGQKLEDQKGSTEYSDYTRKGGILYDEITTPSGSPAWSKNRGELWRRLEAREDRSTRRADAMLAHNFNIALPHELTLEQNIFLARDFVREQFTRKGYAVDWSIHSPDPRGDSRNIHLHILVPLRKIEGESFGNKVRYTKHQLRQQNIAWRRSWATLTNRHLKRYGRKAKIDERSLRAQGINRKPSKHHGKRSKVRRNRLDSIRPLQPLAPIVRTTKHINPDGSIRIRKAIRRTGLNEIGKRSGNKTSSSNHLAPTRPIFGKGLPRNATTASQKKQAGQQETNNTDNASGIIRKSFIYTINTKTNHITSKQVHSSTDIKPIALAANASRKGWPEAAVRDWETWGSKNPPRFFALWPELGATNPPSQGGMHL